MKKIESLSHIGVYQYEDYPNYIVDIFFHADEGLYKIYLSHKDYGIKALMFGLLKEYFINGEFDLHKVIEANLPSHIAAYHDDYED